MMLKKNQPKMPANISIKMKVITLSNDNGVAQKKCRRHEIFIDKKRYSISSVFELSEVLRASLNSKGNKMEMRTGYKHFAATRLVSRQTLKASLLLLALALILGTKSFGAPSKLFPNPFDQSEVRNAVQHIFNQLKAGEYAALYDSLPS